MNKNIFYPIAFIFIFTMFIGCKNSNIDKKRNHNFDAGWLFIKDSLQGAEMPEYDDSGWRKLDLPHDWSIEDLPNQSDSVIGPFSKQSIGGMNTGYFTGGTGWYRKHFKSMPEESNKYIWLNFDGVYMDCDVWLNGNHLTNHPYGYTPFNLNLTKYMNPAGKDNVIAVRVRNLGLNSRWYTGSGIYRHVELIVTDSIHIVPWGIYVTTFQRSPEKATALIVTAINNPTNSDIEINLRTTIFDKDGKISGKVVSKQNIPANKTIPVNQTFEINDPKLWSTDDPEMYKVNAEVLKGKELIDHDETNFGIRTIAIDAENGLRINGKNVFLKGGCVHHDNGLLGSATIDRAEERRVELLKRNGFNAIRTSHNPPSRQFLDACDRLGMLVIDEAFDMWERPKNPDDYARFFDEWAQRDISSMVFRDRNHPSVIFWSIGNEINERADSSGLAIAKRLVDIVHGLDPYRPVTEALCQFWDHPEKSWDATAPAFALLDIGGYNYEWQKYESDHSLFPKRIMAGTESIPMDAFRNWQMVKNHSWVIGDFVWTAIDYMGETAIGHSILDNETNNFRLPWPWFDSNCGDIDLIGNKKPQSYYRDVVWDNSKIEMLAHTPIPAGRKEVISYWGWPDEWPSWNWKGHEGENIQVRVFTKAKKVRLELNGKIIGEQTVSDSTQLTAGFQVPYEPGELKAIGLEDGKEVCSKILSTTGEPAAIRLVPDRASIFTDRNDLSFVQAEVIDKAGNVVPDADVDITFTISGPGQIVAAGSGIPNEMSSFTRPECKTYKGEGMVIVRPVGNPGQVSLKAEATGLNGAEVKIQTMQE